MAIKFPWFPFLLVVLMVKTVTFTVEEEPSATVEITMATAGHFHCGSRGFQRLLWATYADAAGNVSVFSHGNVGRMLPTPFLLHRLVPDAGAGDTV